MKVRNLFAILATLGLVGLVADTAVAQVDVKPGGVTVTGPAGNNLNVPFNGQTPSVTQPGTLQPGTAGTFTPGTQPGAYLPGTTSGYYPGYSTYPGSYQPMYGSNSFYQQPYMGGYQQPYMGGYSYYTPGQQWGATNSYYGQQAVAGGGCCGASVMPASYSAPVAAGGCCGVAQASYSQPIAYGYGGDCGCEGGRHHRRGLFRR